MPSTTQIIPKYKFPYQETYINDNTVYTEPVPAELPPGFQSIAVFASPRGRDNVLLTKKNVNQFLTEYGNLDFRHYGQPMLNAYAMLETGYADVHCMRVMPADANLANAVVYAKVKTERRAATLGEVVSIPATLTATIAAEDLNMVTLTWDVVADATGYQVVINGDTSNPISVSGTTYNHTNLISGRGYSYNVRAVKAGVYSEWGTPINVTAGAIATETVTNTTDTTTVPSGISIKYFMESVDGMKTEDDVHIQLAQYLDEAPDVDGYSTIPLFGVYVLGRGNYGNNFRIRFVTDTEGTEADSTVEYFLEVFDTAVSAKPIERYSVSLNPEVVIGGKSKYIIDVVTGVSPNVGVVGYEDGLQTIYEMYDAVGVAGQANIDNFNILTGKDNAGLTIPGLTIYSPTAEDTAVDFSRIDGLSLAYGADGSFAVTNPELSIAIQETYAKAFNGELNKMILSKQAFPCEVLLDACYDNAVKSEMVALRELREDFQLILDAGIQNTFADVYDWDDSEEIASIDSSIVFKVFQSGVTKDPSNNRNITVTATYAYAKTLPYHFQVVGRHIPMVGETYTLIDWITRDKIFPRVDYDDTSVKSILYSRRLNYIEGIGNGRYAIGTQSSSQKVNSDLLEFNNVAIMLYYKRMLESICKRNSYNFADASAREMFTDTANAALDETASWQESVSVDFTTSAYEAQRSIVHCYMSIVFKPIGKNFIIEIDINSRV